jgi:hypothetical protein
LKFGSIPLLGFLILSLSWSAPSTGAPASQEIKLATSINVLNDRPSGIAMISKVWKNQDDARNRFVIRLYSKAERTDEAGSDYDEQVLAFAQGKPVEFSNWMAPDCSLAQTAIYRAASPSGSRLIVVTAERVTPRSAEIVPQSEPAPQHLRLFVPKTNAADEPGKSSIWLDAVKERTTSESLCDPIDVRRAMDAFGSEGITR